MVIVELQVGLQLAGLKEADAPDGKPEAEKDTDWVEPEVRVVLTVAEIELPWVTEPEVGLMEIEKSNGAS